MLWFFILGNNPELSVAEIHAWFKFSTEKYILVQDKALLVKIEQDIFPEKLIKRLGGTIKIGKIQTIGKQQDILQTCFLLLKKLLDNKQKIRFGFSSYGAKFNFKVMAMEIKKYLKNQDISSRWVTSKEKVLSSVVVEQNILSHQGIEFIVIKNKERFYIGQTMAVQAFKELSRRDYGRPARDAYSGMLPPKLAQIMLNLAQAKNNILDPFCGSGTILMEAILLGIKKVYGSDLSLKAVQDSKRNIDWLIKDGGIEKVNYSVEQNNVLELSKNITPNSIEAIITEPYLGAQRGKIDILKTRTELEKLYNYALQEFEKVLQPQGRVVMVWPVFLQNNRKHYLDLKLDNFKIINPLPKIGLSLTPRKTLFYQRPGQRVGREIVVLQKK